MSAGCGLGCNLVAELGESIADGILVGRAASIQRLWGFRFYFSQL